MLSNWRATGQIWQRLVSIPGDLKKHSQAAWTRSEAGPARARQRLTGMLERK
jgi:hypothetical protein